VASDKTDFGKGFTKGRGAGSNNPGRFASTTVVDFHDIAPDISPDTDDDLVPGKPVTSVTAERCRSIISKNTSPDVPFSQSINPYRGCEHGCIYCFARPTHAYLDLSPGLDFETQLFAKTNAPDKLREALAKKAYLPKTIALGVNTDAYQPTERELQITRQLLEILRDHQHPVSIVTKSALVERDIDLLQEMAGNNLCNVMISVTTLDKALCCTLEPRAAAPQRRLRILKTLSDAGIPVGILFAPVIPFINDHELESIFAAAADNGAASAGYVVLRLPDELKSLWSEWLTEHYPDRASRVMKIVRQMHGDQIYRADFGHRMTGSGAFADLLANRFKLALRRNHLSQRAAALDTGLFRVPHSQVQRSLF